MTLIICITFCKFTINVDSGVSFLGQGKLFLDKHNVMILSH